MLRQPSSTRQGGAGGQAGGGATKPGSLKTAKHFGHAAKERRLKQLSGLAVCGRQRQHIGSALKYYAYAMGAKGEREASERELCAACVFLFPLFFFFLFAIALKRQINYHFRNMTSAHSSSNNNNTRLSAAMCRVKRSYNLNARKIDKKYLLLIINMQATPVALADFIIYRFLEARESRRRREEGRWEMKNVEQTTCVCVLSLSSFCHFRHTSGWAFAIAIAFCASFITVAYFQA